MWRQPRGKRGTREPASAAKQWKFLVLSPVLASSAFFPAVLPALECNTLAKGDPRGGAEGIHHLDFSGFSHFPIQMAFWPLCVLGCSAHPLRVVVPIQGDDIIDLLDITCIT